MVQLVQHPVTELWGSGPSGLEATVSGIRSELMRPIQSRNSSPIAPHCQTNWSRSATFRIFKTLCERLGPMGHGPLLMRGSLRLVQKRAERIRIKIVSLGINFGRAPPISSSQ